MTIEEIEQIKDLARTNSSRILISLMKELEKQEETNLTYIKYGNDPEFEHIFAISDGKLTGQPFYFSELATLASSKNLNMDYKGSNQEEGSYTYTIRKAELVKPKKR